MWWHILLLIMMIVDDEKHKKFTVSGLCIISAITFFAFTVITIKAF